MPTDPRFPIGKAELHDQLDPETRKKLIEQIAYLPAELRAAVRGLNDQQLDTPYRDGGWTVRQLIHHVADSHINAYVRYKLALTEDNPTIKPYEEAEWAKLPDSRLPIEVSLSLLETLHRRWVTLLHGMKSEDFARRMRHPERGEVTMDSTLGLYAWHGRHHTAHITELKKAQGWK